MTSSAPGSIGRASEQTLHRRLDVPTIRLLPCGFHRFTTSLGMTPIIVASPPATGPPYGGSGPQLSNGLGCCLIAAADCRQSHP